MARTPTSGTTTISNALRRPRHHRRSGRGRKPRQPVTRHFRHRHLTVTGDLTLNGNTAVDINASTTGKDLVTGIGHGELWRHAHDQQSRGPLAAGQSYTLFSATTHNGSFASFARNAGCGFGLVVRQRRVVCGLRRHPTFAPPTVSGGNLILTGTGFTPSGTTRG